jgi:hypothetical protein
MNPEFEYEDMGEQPSNLDPAPPTPEGYGSRLAELDEVSREKVLAFAQRWSVVCTRLRDSYDRDEGVLLDATEVDTLIEALRYLKKGAEQDRRSKGN